MSPVFWSVFLVGVYVYLQTTPFESLLNKNLQNIIITLAVFIWSIAVVRISSTVLEELGNKYEDGRTISDAIPFMKTMTAIMILAGTAAVVLTIWEINVAPLIASAGVAGVAVAFAAKDTIGNLFGGISIFFDKPYKVGDFVIIEKQYRGEVFEIGMRSTKITTRDNILITVPNSVMVTSAVINETGMDPKLRIRVPLGVAYGSDLESVEKIFKAAMVKSNLFAKFPAPRVRFRKFSDSSIDMELIGTVNEPVDKGNTTHKLIKLVHKTAKKEKVNIPFPQRDVHLKNKL